MANERFQGGEWWAVLTERERRVLLYLETGGSIEEISASLGIRVGTVKTHLVHIYAKLGIHNRVQAAVYARRLRQAIESDPN